MEEGKRWDLLLLFFSLFFVYNANLRPIAATDSIPARLLPFSILREGNLDLDEFGFGSASQNRASSLPGFVIATRGHLMSFYPVVLPVVISPLYLPAVWILRAYGLSFVDPNTSPAASLLAQVMEKLSASVIASLSALCVYLALRELCERRAALWLTVLYALGTNTWTISSQALWQHGLSELSLSLTLYALLKAKQHTWLLVVAGLGAAIATANRPPNGLFFLLAVVYVWRSYRWGIINFLPRPVLIGLLVLTYNLYFFGGVTGDIAECHR